MAEGGKSIRLGRFCFLGTPQFPTVYTYEELMTKLQKKRAIKNRPLGKPLDLLEN
jgi:hypothetical protein